MFRFMLLLGVLFGMRTTAHSQVIVDHFSRVGTFPTAANDAWQPKQILFLTENVGFVIGSKPDAPTDSDIRIYKTSNGGLNWTMSSVSGIQLASNSLSVTAGGMLYFTCKGVTQNSCGSGGIGYITTKVFYSLDNGTNWLEKRVDNSDGLASASVMVKYIDNQNAILMYKDYINECGILNGIYITNNNFQSSQYLGNYKPSNIIIDSNEYRFWYNQELVRIKPTGAVVKEHKAIRCHEYERVILSQKNGKLYYQFSLSCPEEYGLMNNSWTGIRVENRSDLSSTLKFTDPYSYTVATNVNNSIFSGIANSDIIGFNEVDFDKDSIFRYYTIDKFNFGDTSYVQNTTLSQFLSPTLYYTLGYVPYTDVNYKLFKTTSGQSKSGGSPLQNGPVAGLETELLDEKHNAFKVYPNPTTSYAALRNLNEQTNYLIELISMEGKILERRKIFGRESSEMDLSLMKNGIYLLRINDLDHQKLEVLKLIKN